MTEYYDAEDEELVEEPAIAPPPVTMPRQWSWSTEKLLWAALIVIVVGFVAWFLMAFTGARARAIAEAVGNGGNDSN